MFRPQGGTFFCLGRGGGVGAFFAAGTDIGLSRQKNTQEIRAV